MSKYIVLINDVDSEVYGPFSSIDAAEFWLTRVNKIGDIKEVKQPFEAPNEKGLPRLIYFRMTVCYHCNNFDIEWEKIVNDREINDVVYPILILFDKMNKDLGTFNDIVMYSPFIWLDDDRMDETENNKQNKGHEWKNIGYTRDHIGIKRWIFDMLK